MPLRNFFRIDGTDVLLRATGVALAGGSLTFAAHMTADPDRKPQIVGVEHLAIYAKPATSAARRAQLEARAGVDYTPVGSTRSAFPDSNLVGFDLIEAASGRATIRTPQGRVTRVSSGAKLAGVGEIVSIHQRNGKWVVVTQAGLIQQP